MIQIKKSKGPKIKPCISNFRKEADKNTLITYWLLQVFAKFSLRIVVSLLAVKKFKKNAIVQTPTLFNARQDKQLSMARRVYHCNYKWNHITGKFGSCLDKS